MSLFYTLMSLLAGILMSIQSVVNANLAHGLGNRPVLAAFVSFLIGTILLAIMARWQNQLDWSLLKQLTHQEWWKLLGGALGAYFVFTSVLVAPKLGLVTMFLFIVFGQLSSSFLIDSFGLLGLPGRPVSWNKIAGLFVVVAGLLLYFFKDILAYYK